MRNAIRLLTVIALILLVPAVPRSAPAPDVPAQGPAIRLVLLIAVDQFRYDYLTRFRSEYTSGLNRLLTEGADFTNAFLEHYPTVTAVGHSTMMSGATPALSGIVGNDWFDRALGKSVTSVEDPDTQLVGGSEGIGFSPRRMLVDTVGDELKSASRAPVDSPLYPKVFGLSLKDRSAALPAGHMANAAFCFDTKTGAFVTSTYYRRDLPAWAAAFNAKRPADAFAGKTWTYLDPAAGTAGTLPPVGDTLYNAVFGSPFGNELLLSFALTAIEAEQLGQRGVTDLLSVSFSSNDSIGHSFGPDSPQVRDISVRTDRIIGELLARVEALVGLDHTLVVLTADHGVAPVPEVQQQRHLPGGRLTKDEAMTPIARALVAKYGEGDWIIGTAGTSPYLNYALIAEKQLDPAEVRKVAAAAAAALPHVARVYTRDQVLSGQVTPDTIGLRIARSENLMRSGDLEIVFEPYWMRASGGTTHGTPYLYDAHIPLVFMGPGIRAGHYDANVALNDLAPTVATLIAVETPSGSQGRVLTEMLSATESPRPGSH
jgi:type I phosphodiesterase/nucleotide pyrophosphatase